MSGFKLIGIIPLARCSKRFLKNLKVGEQYCFYQGYEVKLNDGKTIVETFKHSNKNYKEISLYNSKDEIDISISAVVGENGSGKSSLIELFYYVIYLLGTSYKRLDAEQNELNTIIDASPNRINYEITKIQELKRKWNRTSTNDENEKLLLAEILWKYTFNIHEKGDKK